MFHCGGEPEPTRLPKRVQGAANGMCGANATDSKCQLLESPSLIALRYPLLMGKNKDFEVQGVFQRHLIIIIIIIINRLFSI